MWAWATREIPQAKRALCWQEPHQEMWVGCLQFLLQTPHRNVSAFVYHFPSRVPLCASAFLASGRLPFYFLVFGCLRSVYWECTFQKGLIIGYEKEVKAFFLCLRPLWAVPGKTFAESNITFCHFKDVSDTFSILAFVTNKMRLLES